MSPTSPPKKQTINTARRRATKKATKGKKQQPQQRKASQPHALPPRRSTIHVCVEQVAVNTRSLPRTSRTLADLRDFCVPSVNAWGRSWCKQEVKQKRGGVRARGRVRESQSRDREEESEEKQSEDNGGQTKETGQQETDVSRLSPKSGDEFHHLKGSQFCRKGVIFTTCLLP